jgi:uncharacterized membrane protein
LLTALSDNRDRWGETRLTMEELGDITAMSRTTLWRALTVLSEKGLVETTRTKRNLGRLYKNRYRVIEFETSTAGQGSYNSQLDTVTTDSHIKNTSYSFGAEGTEEEPMVNKWKEEDEFMSFGLIDEAPPTQKISKADPKTRRLRPQEEWTALDVASEFSFRVYDNIRGIPGIVNTMNLRGALSRNRSKFAIDASIEMSIMDKFFADARNLHAIKRTPKNAIGIFLNYITNNITSARNEVTIEQALAMAEELEYLYASDGRKFDKSIAGRAALTRYEKKLKGE